ncbi:riboflavin transporter 2-like [Lytechinus pictus]|uniref:riboflavin transporter 2-like n=1 Tax=Lytechinus pictus TaxID=7653 RepID=UPI0030B9B6AA
MEKEGQIRNRPGERILVIVLVVLFGSGAWVSVSGVWTELPIMISTGLPEQYRMTSIVHILIQFSLVGMIAFLICNKLVASTRIYRLEIPWNYGITFLGTIATFLLIFFWDTRAYVFGELHSVAFLCLVFFVSLVDITSNVTFVGFMSLMKPNLMNWFWIGEGLGHILPAFVVLIQQSNGKMKSCVVNDTYLNETVVGNSTVMYNCTSWEEVAPQLLFEPKDYFVVLFLMMLACHISFICLNNLPCSRREYVPQADGHHLRTDGCGGLFKQSETLSADEEDGDRVRLMSVVRSHEDGSPNAPDEENDNSGNDLAEQHLTKRQVVFLYTVFFINFTLSFGIMGPILGFSGSAYGNDTFEILVPMQEIAIAVAYFLFLLKPIYSFKVVAGSLLLAIACYTYDFVVAAASPNPPFYSIIFGKIYIVLNAVTRGLSSRYCHASTVWILRNSTDSRRHLIVSAAIGQVGVFIGSVTMFVLINVFNVFESHHETKSCPSFTCSMME